MSAFLGPIHGWLYGKILYQEEVTMKLLEMSEKNNWCVGLRDALKEACAEPVIGELEDVIDSSNIHGWLLGQINIVEARYAFVVHELLRDNAPLMGTLEVAMAEIGRAKFNAEYMDLECIAIGNVLQAILLDGMPCDGGVSYQIQEEDHILWDVNMAVHAPYWAELDENPEVFLHLRDAWLTGFFTETPFAYMRTGDTSFSVRRDD